jgi:dTDP-4-amino-4,6-dideoxygalactose transaminase
MPKVIEAVHILGHPGDVAPVLDVCAKYGVALIEDAAEAVGARFASGSLAGRAVGTVGVLGCFSFNGNKIMTTGGGGMITTDDAELARRAKHLTTQARLPGPEYDHDEVGYNYRLTNLAAALGVAQLEQLPSFLEKKRVIRTKYDAALGDLRGVVLPPRQQWATPSDWLYTIGLVPGEARLDRIELMRELGNRGIQTRPIWRPLHLMPMFAAAPRLGCATAERLFTWGLSLPCSVSLTDEQQSEVVAAIRELIG